eukprot:GHVN01105240.1.p2 GENE.GHVN01105240.1~~GHVN01105240.1.p2  ORF type:complete len:113 (+),score=21.65 GHVN01105240.1:337-675(+)
MNGNEVFKFASREVPAALSAALRRTSLTFDHIDHLLLHQANRRIMEAVAERLGISKQKLICNLDEYGNTSAASIPIALDDAVRSRKVRPRDTIAMSGFGAGLSLGAAIVKWQ